MSAHVDEVNNVGATGATDNKGIFGESGNYFVQPENLDSVTGDEFQFFFGLHYINHEFR